MVTENGKGKTKMPSNINYKLGVIDQALKGNEEAHRVILATLDGIRLELQPIKDWLAGLRAESAMRIKQHEEILKTFTEVVDVVKPLESSISSKGTQIEVNTRRLDIIESELKIQGKVIEYFRGKAVVYGALASAVVAGLFYGGRLFLQHLGVPCP